MEKHTITWRGIRIEITFTPEKFGMSDHIELHSENRIALPVTETGYRSHFIPMGPVMQQGGPVPFVTAWLNYEAERTGWRGTQLTLL